MRDSSMMLMYDGKNFLRAIEATIVYFLIFRLQIIEFWNVFPHRAVY